MSINNKSKVIFNAVVAGKQFKKFEKSTESFMNSTWEKFNNYAHHKGFTIPVEDKIYLGSMAWSNGSEIMELVKL